MPTAAAANTLTLASSGISKIIHKCAITLAGAFLETGGQNQDHAELEILCRLESHWQSLPSCATIKHC